MNGYSYAAKSHLQAFPDILASGLHFEIILCVLMIRLKTLLEFIMKLHYILPCGICCLHGGLYDFFNGELLNFSEASHSLCEIKIRMFLSLIRADLKMNLCMTFLGRFHSYLSLFWCFHISRFSASLFVLHSLSTPSVRRRPDGCFILQMTLWVIPEHIGG